MIRDLMHAIRMAWRRASEEFRRDLARARARRDTVDPFNF